MICVVAIKIQWNPRLKCFALKGRRDANQLFMHCLEISIEIILFEEFCEHKMIWQKTFNARSSSLGKLGEYKFLQMKSGKCFQITSGVKKKLLFHSTSPVNSFQHWFSQVIRTQMEEACIIVIY